MPQIKLFGFAPSTYTQTALLVCAEVELEIELESLAFKEPSHFKLHPYGKMPALTHGEVSLYETLAIVSYVNQTFGKGRLEPTNPVDRARMFQFVSAAIDYLYQDLVQPLHDEPSSKIIVNAAARLKLLNGQMTGTKFLAGSDVSLADFFVAPMVRFASDKLGRSSLDKLPTLHAWLETIMARPSAKKVW